MTERMMNSILQLHKWRCAFNGHKIGNGYDQYKPKNRCNYPEAYAVFGHGYLNLYRATKNSEYLKCAEDCAEWLLGHLSPKYDNMAWGLPFAWKEREAPEDLAYLVTTTFVADFFLEYYRIKRSKRIENGISSIVAWMIDENGYKKCNDGILLYYANHHTLKHDIYNPSALATGVLSSLDKKFYTEPLDDIIYKSIRFIVKNQNSDGSWPYSERERIVDNFHTGLVLEGLLKYIETHDKDEEAYTSYKKGLYFYKKKLFTRMGRGKEFVNKFQRQKKFAEALSLYGYYTLREMKRLNQARAWSYGSALRILSNPISREMNDNFDQKIVEYAISTLQMATGEFRFTETDKSAFIRNEAHMFDGLTTFLCSDIARKNNS